jgi:hypothetical protein
VIFGRLLTTRRALLWRTAAEAPRAEGIGMSAVILIAAVIVVVMAVVLLKVRSNKRRATSHHIGLPELGVLVEGGRAYRRWRSTHERRGITPVAAAAWILGN